jgi:hypothetical protein
MNWTALQQHNLAPLGSEFRAIYRPVFIVSLRVAYFNQPMTLIN